MIIDPQSVQSGGTYLTADLPDLIIREAGIGSVTVEVIIGGSTVYHESLIPIDGVVSVSCFSLLLTHELERLFYSEVTVHATSVDSSSVSATFTVYYSRVRVFASDSSFLSDHFLTLSGRRTTRVGYSETLFAYLSSSEGYDPAHGGLCTATYDDGSVMFFALAVAEHSSTAEGLVSVDASASQFVDSDCKKRLVRYVVKLGLRSMTYDIDFRETLCSGHLRFSNVFGMPDVVPVVGAMKKKTTFSRSAGWFSGSFRQYDAVETTETDISSGYVDEDAFALWLDCARTDELVFFRRGYEAFGEPFVITGEKIEHSDEDDALHVVTLTVRPTSRFPGRELPETFRLFDATFDETFD